MTAESVLRRRPFAVAEVMLVVLLGVGAATYVWLVASTTPGAWTAANALLALASLLGVVLAGHAVRDLHRLVTEPGWASSWWLSLVGACWRLLELGLVVAFVVFGVLSGSLSSDLATTSAEGEGTMGMVLGIWLLVDAAILGVVVLMVPARVLATGGGGANAEEDGSSETSSGGDQTSPDGDDSPPDGDDSPPDGDDSPPVGTDSSPDKDETGAADESSSEGEEDGYVPRSSD